MPSQQQLQQFQEPDPTLFDSPYAPASSQFAGPSIAPPARPPPYHPSYTSQGDLGSNAGPDISAGYIRPSAAGQDDMEKDISLRLVARSKQQTGGGFANQAAAISALIEESHRAAKIWGIDTNTPEGKKALDEELAANLHVARGLVHDVDPSKFIKEVNGHLVNIETGKVIFETPEAKATRQAFESGAVRPPPYGEEHNADAPHPPSDFTIPEAYLGLGKQPETPPPATSEPEPIAPTQAASGIDSEIPSDIQEKMARMKELERFADIKNTPQAREYARLSREVNSAKLLNLKTQAEKNKLAGKEIDPDSVELFGQALADGTAPYTARGNPSPFIQKAFAAAKKIDPDFTPATFVARQKMRNDFASSTGAGGNVTSLNTVLGHLNNWSEASKELKNSDIQYWNSIKNTSLTKLAGDPRAGRLIIDSRAIASELARVFKGVGASSEEEIKRWEATLSPNLSPAQMQESIKEMVKLLATRSKALSDQWERGMGKKRVDPILGEEARAVMKNFGLDPDKYDPVSGAKGQQAGGAVVPPGYKQQINRKTGETRIVPL